MAFMPRGLFPNCRKERGRIQLAKTRRASTARDLGKSIRPALNHRIGAWPVTEIETA